MGVVDGGLQVVRKALDLGGNSVLGYSFCFDLEGGKVIARGAGTACFVSEDTESSSGSPPLGAMSPLFSPSSPKQPDWSPSLQPGISLQNLEDEVSYVGAAQRNMSADA